MSADGFTCVMVTDTPSSSGSRMSERARICARAWRSISPTLSWRWDGPCSRRAWRDEVWLPPRGERFLDTRPSQRALDGFDLETLDDVALLHVLIVGEGHAAFLADLDLAHFVLEALERRQVAFMDHDIVADQANLRATAHQAFGDLAARHLADLGDREDFQDFRIAEEFLARLGREHARQHR